MDTDKTERTTTEQIIDQMGGASGLVLSTVPVIALVVAHLFLPLMPTLAVAIGAGAVLFVVRLARGEKVPSAIGSLLGVALAAGIVIWTGSVRDFFVIGIWAALAIFIPTAISVVARRPLTGMIWNAVHGGEHTWREDRPTFRAHVIATAAIAVAHLAKFVVQQWLYVAGNVTALGVADTVMGAPLTIVLALVVVWAFRRSTTRLRAAEERHEESTTGPREDAADARLGDEDTVTADLIDETEPLMPTTSTLTIDDLLRPPERSGITISPDGTRLACLSMWHERLNIWVEEIDAGTEPRCVTADDSRSIVRYLWADDSRHLLYQQDSGGDENWHVFRIDVDEPGAPAVDLTPFPGASVQGLELRQGRPGHATFQMNAQNPAEFDLYDLEIATGTLSRLAPTPGAGSTWMLVGDTLLRRCMRADGTWELWRGETLIATFDGDAYPMDVYPFEAAPDGSSIWFGSYHGTDHLHPARLDLATGEETMIHHHPRADLDTRPLVFTNLPSPLIRHRLTGELLGVRYHGMRMHTVPLAPHFAEVLEAVGTLCDGDIGTITSDVDQRRWVVSFLHDRDPQTWLYDHRTGRSRLLARSLEHLDVDQLAPVESVEITARDGLRLPTYLTLPAHEEPRDLPLVLMPHGGPWTRDWWGFDSIVQLWASRGYAVLQPQFRGSAGFGRTHMEAGVGELAGRMHDDLLDTVDWAIDQGYADPDRIGVFGGSYGGYAALVGVAFTPERFAAAVEYVGVSDLVDYLRSLPEHARPGLVNNWYRYAGDPSDPEQAADMRARSPITRIGDIRSPLMVVQGANDVRVSRENSDRIVAGLREQGNEVEYLVFDDEGHFILNPENLRALYHAADQFLARHLAKVRAAASGA